MAKGVYRSDVLIIRQFERNNSRGYIWLQNVPKYNSSLLGISLGMIILFIILLVTLLCLKQGTRNESKFRIVTKKEWQGNPPTNKTTPLVTPVPYVIIHHTATENCSTLAECASHLRAIQAFHVNSRAWYDIGYNFMVGGDGLVYEGRGWTEEGAHTLGVNFKSIGIAFIGTFIQIAPPVQQLQACKDLIKLGIELNYIKKDYHLFGAKQFYGTESPGTALMTEIKTWDRWAKIPNVTYT
ncbi:peptidoglycan-recognition protein SC2-like isoform X2 [Anthonomus grandis grandis]|uniref:peptidoglycan-recognition protein SC2-like isoform X2 n=1 Tax=Anthonomus grandis grandis TaxID=2921223 RepID=UPI002166B607|nr:peptidoglycan-recognition protein SC2-like isoform X2 [Anthonomus grandis grandis]